LQDRKERGRRASDAVAHTGRPLVVVVVVVVIVVMVVIVEELFF
jgi:hypothetical protein